VRTEGIRFVFSGAALDSRSQRSIRLPADELSSYSFVGIDEAADLIAPALHRRLVVARAMSKGGSMAYLEDGVSVG
jgi:hypothetical protein